MENNQKHRALYFKSAENINVRNVSIYIIMHNSYNKSTGIIFMYLKRKGEWDMKKGKYRWLAILLIVAMLFGMLPGQYTVANASDLEEGTEVKLENNDSTLAGTENYLIEPAAASGSAIVVHKWEVKSLANTMDKTTLAQGVYEQYFKVDGDVVQRTSSTTEISSVKSLEVGKGASSSIQFTVTGTADAVIEMSSTGGSNTSSVGLYDQNNNLVAEKNDVKTITGTGAVALTYTGLPAGTYKIVSPPDSNNRGARFYSATVTEIEGERPPRKDWDQVADPVITNAEIKSGNIVVSFTMEIGYDGADSVIVTMNKDGETIKSESYAKDGSTGSVSFTPSSSGEYTFTISSVRDENVKTGMDYTVSNFALPLSNPSITSATSAGKGSVFVAWNGVKEADSYEVSYKASGAADFTVAKKVTETECVIDKLTVDVTYEIRVRAFRGTEYTEAIDSVTVTEEAQRVWYFSAWGPSAKPENNSYEGDANSGFVTIESKNDSGKLQPTSADGLAFYYTKIDPEKENFILSATIKVDRWFMSGGQSGFGIMAADTVGSHGDQSTALNNSYMVTSSKVEYYWDKENEKVSDAGDKITMKNGIGAQEKIGITPENIADGTATKALKSTMFPLETFYANMGVGEYNVIGNKTANNTLEGELSETDLITTLQLKIQRDNTGYRLSYTDEAGNTTTKLYYDIDRNALTQLDKDNIYVGFYASRSARITISDINLTITDPEKDAPPEDIETTYVTPSYRIISTTDTGNSTYKLVYLGNADGRLTIKDSNGNLIANEEVVVANTTVKKDVILSKGANLFTITFTPNKDYVPGENQKLSNYDPSTFTHTVINKNYNRKNLYVTPNGRSSGDGSKSNPLDIYTAVKYVTPGQKIVLAGGVYSMNSPLTVARGVDGTKDAMIYMIAETESRPVFDFNQKVTGMVFAGDYWYIQGFDVTNSADGQKGLQLSGSNCTLDDIQAYGNGNTGIQLSRYLSSDNFEDWPANNLILNCTSYGNVDKGYADADGFAAKLTIGEGNVFDGCIAYNNADDGWDLFAKPETGPIGKVVVKNSVAFRNGYLLDGRIAGNGNGFKLGGSSITGYHELINSVTFDNRAKGIDSNSCPDIQVSHSTTYNNESYNVAFYTSDAKNTDFSANGILSYKTLYTSVSENLKLLGSQDNNKVYGKNNYYWLDGKSTNTENKEVSSDWFVNLDTTTEITRNEDGTINMNGLLELTDKAPQDAGARMTGTPSRVIEIEEETVTPQPTQAPSVTATPTPTPTATPTPTKELTKEEIIEHLTPKRTGSLYTGGKSSNLGWFGLKLPENVVKVANFDEETLSKLGEGIVPITITYTSNKPGIVTVKQNGRLIAKESGVAIITATVTMQDGTKEVYTRKLSVKKATIDFVESTVRMKVGEEAVFEVKVNGLDEDSIVWMSSQKDGAVVKKNPGSTTATIKAVSPKTDWIYVIVDGVKKAIRVIIEE